MTLDQALAEFGLKVNLSLTIMAMALLLSRILPIVFFSPFLGGETVPTEVKIGVGLMLALVLFPAIPGRIAFIPTSPLPFVGLMLKEVFIGVSLAFVVNRVFDAAVVAGTLVDTFA